MTEIWNVPATSTVTLSLNNSTWRGFGMHIEAGFTYIGENLTEFTFQAKRTNTSPDSTLTFGVWDSTSTSDTPVSTFTVTGVTVISDIATTFTTYTAVGNHTIAAGDIIGILPNTPASNFFQVHVSSANMPTNVKGSNKSTNWDDDSYAEDKAMIGTASTGADPASTRTLLPPPPLIASF